MPMLSLGQAARAAGVGKTTLTRAIKGGKLSAARNADGSYAIDPAELARVYDVTPETPETGCATGGAVHRETPAAVSRDSPDTPETLARLAALQSEVQGLRDLLAEVRQSRDDWRDQAGRLALAKPAAPPVEAPAPPALPWWRRLAG